MIYLSQMIGIPVLDANGEKIGTVNDLGIATGEVFPRVTALAFQGPGKTPFMISWRKYVDSFDDDEVRLKVPATDIRFSYLQPEEVLIARDLLNKQIVDTRGLRVVRVNDLKLSDSGSNQLRLLGAEVGARGILRSLSPHLEKATLKVAHLFGKEIPEKIIAWSYMDLLDRELSDVQLSVSHKTLDDMHPADIADIIEQLDPRLRGQVFAQLDDAQAALAMAELDDDEMAAEIMGDMSAQDASRMLSAMDPDDAAELVSELDYKKAETLLRLMGVQEERAIRQLLGYRDETAGRIMTSLFVSLHPNDRVQDAIDAIRTLDEDEVETVNYIYLTDDEGRLQGVLPLRALLVSDHDTRLGDIMETDVISVSPEADQEDVADAISKYNLLAIPVVGDDRKILGIVTVDDALDVLEEEHEEDLQLAGGHTDTNSSEPTHELRWLLLNQTWFFFWAIGAAAFALCAEFMKLPVQALLPAVAMPVALLMSDSMINYVTGFFIEFDQGDDSDAPSVANFTFRGLGICLVYVILVVLVGLGAQAVLTDRGLGDIAGLDQGLITAAITSFIGYLTAPVYLRILRKRDTKGQDTTRISLRVTAFIVCIVIFIALNLGYMAFAG